MIIGFLLFVVLISLGVLGYFYPDTYWKWSETNAKMRGISKLKKPDDWDQSTREAAVGCFILAFFVFVALLFGTFN